MHGQPLSRNKVPRWNSRHFRSRENGEQVEGAKNGVQPCKAALRELEIQTLKRFCMRNLLGSSSEDKRSKI